MLIKSIIVIVLSIYLGFILVYVVSNFIYTILKKQGKLVTIIREASLEFSGPILKAINSFLPAKYKDFAPLIAFVVISALRYIVLTF